MAQNNQSFRRPDLIRLDPWFRSLPLQVARPVLEPLILGLAGARRINRAYRETAALPDHMAFFEKCIQVLKIDLQVTARDRRRLPAEGPLVVVNHPFGGLDGIVPGAMMAAVCWVSRGRLIPSFRQGPPFDKQREIVTPFSEHQDRQTCRHLKGFFVPPGRHRREE